MISGEVASLQTEVVPLINAVGAVRTIMVPVWVHPPPPFKMTV